MTAREFLSLSETLRREIAYREERAADLRRMASSLAPALRRDVRVQSAPRADRLETLVAEAADEEQKALLLREKRGEMLMILALSASRLRDRRMCRLIELRYLEGRSWPETARTLDLSESRTFRLHQLALEQLPAFPDLRFLPEKEKTGEP